MTEIRPVSDLRNKFSEIETLVAERQAPVFLTKNGYGSMVVLSIDEYSRLTENVEYALDVSDRVAKETDVRYSHNEVFSKLRGVVNEG